MPTYTKMTLSTFKKKLENGEYKDVTGARRAIGKTQDLNESEKIKARKLAEGYFGVTDGGSKTKAKKSKKTGRKAKVKKLSAKTKKKVRSTIDKAPSVPKKGPVRTGKRGPRVRMQEAAPAAPASTRQPVVEGAMEQLDLMTAQQIRRHPVVSLQVGSRVIGSVSEAVKAMKLAQDSGDKDAGEGIRAAVGILSRAVTLVDRDVIDPLLDENKSEKAAASTTTKPAKKTRQRKNGVTTAAPEVKTAEPVEEEEEPGAHDVEETEEAEPASSLHVDTNYEPSEAERRAADLLAKARERTAIPASRS